MSVASTETTRRPDPIPRLCDSLAEQSARFRLYTIITILLFSAAVGVRGWHTWRTGERLDFVVSDAKGYYVYLPSLVVDGDLDFRNQMQATFGRELNPYEFDINDLTERGLVRNKYHVGMALTLLPPFLTGHCIALLANLPADGYSPPYQVLCLAFILMRSCATMRLADRLVEAHFKVDGRMIAAGIVAFWLGSNYAWYCFREPFMVHVVSCFWVTLVVHECAKIRRGEINRRSVALLSLGFSMAILCRPSNLFISPFVVWAFAGFVVERPSRPPHFRAAGTAALQFAPVALVGLLPVLAQIWAWHEMTGHWISYSYGDEGFAWLQPALVQTLFSWQKGLFVWTPLLLVAVAGLLLHRRQGLIACWLICAAILWYVNSSWWCWSFGWSFGGRAFLELGAMFITGLVLVFEWARLHAALMRRTVVWAVVIFAIHNYVLMGLYQSHRISRGDWRDRGYTLSVAPEWMHAKIRAGEAESQHAELDRRQAAAGE